MFINFFIIGMFCTYSFVVSCDTINSDLNCCKYSRILSNCTNRLFSRTAALHPFEIKHSLFAYVQQCWLYASLPQSYAQFTYESKISNINVCHLHFKIVFVNIESLLSRIIWWKETIFIHFVLIAALLYNTITKTKIKPDIKCEMANHHWLDLLLTFYHAVLPDVARIYFSFLCHDFIEIWK